MGPIRYIMGMGHITDIVGPIITTLTDHSAITGGEAIILGTVTATDTSPMAAELGLDLRTAADSTVGLAADFGPVLAWAPDLHMAVDCTAGLAAAFGPALASAPDLRMAVDCTAGLAADFGAEFIRGPAAVWAPGTLPAAGYTADRVAVFVEGHSAAKRSNFRKHGEYSCRIMPKISGIVVMQRGLPFAGIRKMIMMFRYRG
jgi:hypothetical protein